MKLTQDLVRAAQPHLSHAQLRAPREVLAAMVSLTPPDHVTARLTWSAASGEGMTWRVLWLSATTLTYCEATRDQGREWSFDSAPAAPGSVRIESRVFKLERILSLKTAGVKADPASGIADVQVKQEIEVAGMDPIPVPLSGDYPTWQDDDACSEFTLHLRTAISRHG